MINRYELQEYLNQLLDCASFKDYAPNGLQIEGKQQIKKICTAVTASKGAIEQAIHAGADALLVHHGYFWKGEEAVITGLKKQRISSLLSSNINLFAYHLPLDCHLEFGNNACLSKFFKLDDVHQHQAGHTNNLLWTGTLSKVVSGKDLNELLKDTFQQEPVHIEIKNKPVRQIAWCTGGAQDFIELAAQLNADAYISGEISERTYYQAHESDIHYFACGHHATERYGIQALGQHLSKCFHLTHEYIETNNPI